MQFAIRVGYQQQQVHQGSEDFRRVAELNIELSGKILEAIVGILGDVEDVDGKLSRLGIQPQVVAHYLVDDFNLIFTEPLEYWTAYFRVSLLLGISISMPVHVYQVLAFVSPGLTWNERKWLYPIVVGATFSFLVGAAFAYYIELPPALKFLIDQPGDISDVRPFIKIQSYINFVTRLILATALVFELPLVVMGLAKIGVVTSKKLLGWWRFAIVGAFVAAAIVTPSIDPITQSLVAGPIIVLYFVGIALAKLVEGSPMIARD